MTFLPPSPLQPTAFSTSLRPPPNAHGLGIKFTPSPCPKTLHPSCFTEHLASLSEPSPKKRLGLQHASRKRAASSPFKYIPTSSPSKSLILSMYSPRKGLLSRSQSAVDSLADDKDGLDYSYDYNFDHLEDEDERLYHSHIQPEQPAEGQPSIRPPSLQYLGRSLSSQDYYVPQPVAPPQGPNFRASQLEAPPLQSAFILPAHPPPPPRSHTVPRDILMPSDPALPLQEEGSHHLAFTPNGNHLARGDPVTHTPDTPFTPSGPAYSRSRPEIDLSNSPKEKDSTGLPAPRPRSQSTGGLERAGTLLSHGVGPVKNARELTRILGKGESGRKVVGGAKGRGEEVDVRLEAGKRKARVQIDVLLERDIVVEGGDIQGRMEVKIGDWNKKEGDVLVGGGKVRIVGFEDIPSHGSRHIFFHHSHTLPLFVPDSTEKTTLFDDTADSNNTLDQPYRQALAGSHDLPFLLPLPITNFPRGPFRTSHGSIKYILIASLKLFFPSTGKKSIAHFYRQLTVYPFLEMSKVLMNYEPPREAKREFKSGSGKTVRLAVKAARTVWVAGQQCWLDVGISNGSSKKIKNLTLSIFQIVTFFHPAPNLAISASANQDAVQTSSRRKLVSESVLEVGQSGGRGLITGKGWWKGCEPGQSGSWGCSVLLPPDALSIPRGRLIEVSYVVRISLNHSHQVELPIRIINFISIDPPPCLNPRQASQLTATVTNRQSNGVTNDDQLVNGPRNSVGAPLANPVRPLSVPQVSTGTLQSIAPDMRPLRVINPSSPSEPSTTRGPPPLSHRVSMAFIKERVDAAAADDAHTQSSDDEMDGADGDSYFDFSTSVYAPSAVEERELEDEEVIPALHEPFSYEEISEPDLPHMEYIPQPVTTPNTEIGLAVQNMSLNDSDQSDLEADERNYDERDYDEQDGDEEILNLTTRFSLHPSSPHPVVQSRSSSATPTTMERKASTTTFSTVYIADVPPTPASLSGVARPSPRPSSFFSPSYEEVRQAARRNSSPKVRSTAEQPERPAGGNSRLRSSFSVTTESRYEDSPATYSTTYTEDDSPDPVPDPVVPRPFALLSPSFEERQGVRRNSAPKPQTTTEQPEHPAKGTSRLRASFSVINERMQAASSDDPPTPVPVAALPQPPTRPFPFFSPSFEERQEVRRNSAPKLHSTAEQPERYVGGNSRLRASFSVATEPLHIVAKNPQYRNSIISSSERSTSPTKSFSSASSRASQLSSPTKSITKKPSFTFASPAAPVRVKANTGLATTATARLRASASLSDLKRRPGSKPSPVKVRNASVVVGMSSAPMSGDSPSEGDYPARSGLVQNAKSLKMATGVMRRSQSAFPIEYSGGAHDVPGLASSSSESGSISETTPPLPSQPQMADEVAVLGIASPAKLAYTSKLLSQASASKDSTQVLHQYFVPVDLDNISIRAQTMGKTSSSPSVQNKIRQLEIRNSALKQFTAPATPAIRRATTTRGRISTTSTPTEEFPSFIRPGFNRMDTCQTDDSGEYLLLTEDQKADLRRAPSAVSFKAPVLRHSKSIHNI